jgi:hypothetical protein
MKEYTSDIKPDNKALKKLVKQFAKKHMPNKLASYLLIKSGGAHPNGAMPRVECKKELLGELQYVLDGRPAHVMVIDKGIEINNLAYGWQALFRVEESNKD